MRKSVVAVLSSAIALTAFALAALQGPSAQAADLPVKKASPVVAAAPPSWTGWYIGAQVGGTRADWNVSPIVWPGAPGASPLAPPGFAVGGLDDLGWAGGLNVGYNYQFGNFVLGFEADINWTNASNSRNFGTVGTLNNLSVETSVDYYYSLRARAGVVVDRALFYVTGGGAWAKSEIETGGFGTLGPASLASSDSAAHSGWVLGAGFDYWISPQWIVGLEYKHFDFGRKNYALVWPLGTVFTSSDLTLDEVTLRVKYKF
jgi:outer membrane immunogenic protein